MYLILLYIVHFIVMLIVQIREEEGSQISISLENENFRGHKHSDKALSKIYLYEVWSCPSQTNNVRQVTLKMSG